MLWKISITFFVSVVHTVTCEIYYMSIMKPGSLTLSLASYDMCIYLMQVESKAVSKSFSDAFES